MVPNPIFRFFFPSMSTKPQRSFMFTISTFRWLSMVSGSLSHFCSSYWKWLGKHFLKKQINNTSERREIYLLCLLNNKFVSRWILNCVNVMIHEARWFHQILYFLFITRPSTRSVGCMMEHGDDHISKYLLSQNIFNI